MPIEVTTKIRWSEIVRVVCDCAANEPVDTLSIYDAERLEAAAREIRKRLKKESTHAR